MCPSHTLSKYKYKLHLIRRLEQVEEEQAKNAVEEPETRSEEAKSSGLVLVEGSAAVPTHEDSVDNWLHGEQSTGTGKDSAFRDPVAMEDASLGAAISSTPQTPTQGAALASEFAFYDSRLAELPQSAGLKLTTDTEPESYHDAENIAGAFGSHSASKWNAILSDSSPIHGHSSSVVLAHAPDEIQAVESQPTFLDTPTSTDVSPGIITSESTPDIADLGLLAVVPLFDNNDAPGGDAPKPRNEDVEASLSTSRAVNPTVCKDEISSLSNVVDGLDNDGNVAGSSKEGLGP